MKIVNKIFIICSLLLLGCQTKNENVSVIDYAAETKVFKLQIIDDGIDDFYVDDRGRCEIKIDEVVLVDSIPFSGPDKFREAVKFAKKNPGENEHSIRFDKTLSIMTKHKQYQKIFAFSDFVLLDNKGSGGYSITDMDLKIDQGVVQNGKEINNCLKVIFEQPDDGNGFKQWILNFAFTNKKWRLVSRERINTMDGESEPRGYCKDTINRNIPKELPTPFNITNEMIYDLKDVRCN